MVAAGMKEVALETGRGMCGVEKPEVVVGLATEQEEFVSAKVEEQGRDNDGVDLEMTFDRIREVVPDDEELA